MKHGGFNICVIFLTLISCNEWKKSQVSVTKDWYSYVKIPQRQFFARYYGDYVFSQTPTKEDKKFAKRSLKTILGHKGKIIYIAQTIVPPFYKEYLIQLTHSVPNKVFDSLNLDGEKFLFYTFAYKKKNYVLIHFPNSHRVSYEPVENATFIQEFKDIYNSIYIGKGFDEQIQMPDFFQEADSAFFSTRFLPNYLAPIELLNKLSSIYGGVDAKADWALLQAKLTYNSFLMQGNKEYQALLKNWREETGSVDEKTFRTDTTLLQIDVHSLLDSCKEKQVVFINENHFMPKHRYLIYLLLDSLKAYGFTKIAIEDYRPLQTDSYVPSQQDGYYVREPIMGEILRKAKRLGMDIISYDSITASNREEVSAQRLVEKTIQKNKAQKLVVLCGISHLSEVTNTGKKWMAYYFKSYSGIDPYTIDQTSYENYASLTHPHSLFIKKSNRANANLFIINNLNPFEDDTLSTNLLDNARISNFLKTNTKKKKNYAVLMYDKNEWKADSLNSVPIRTFYLEYSCGSSDAKVGLKTGSYVLVVSDEFGRMIDDSITIK